MLFKGCLESFKYLLLSFYNLAEALAKLDVGSKDIRTSDSASKQDAVDVLHVLEQVLVGVGDSKLWVVLATLLVVVMRSLEYESLGCWIELEVIADDDPGVVEVVSLNRVD